MGCKFVEVRTDGDIGGGDNLPSRRPLQLPCRHALLCCDSSSRTCQKWATLARAAAGGEVCVRAVRLRRLLQDGGQDEGGVRHGWLVHTGDIGLWTASGYLRIVDRKKNIFKLSPGNVAAEKIEMALMRCPLVAQFFVCDSLQSYLVGICVPDEDAVTLWAKSNNIPKTSLSANVQRGIEGQAARGHLAQVKAASKEPSLRALRW